MDSSLKIKDMHCDACRSLVLMELEDAGFTDNVQQLEIHEGTYGILQLTGVSEEDLEKIKGAINAMEQYSVEESA